MKEIDISEDKKVFNEIYRKDRRRLNDSLIFKVYPDILSKIISQAEQVFTNKRFKVRKLLLTYSSKQKYKELFGYIFYCLNCFKEQALKDEIVIYAIWYLRESVNNSKEDIKYRKKAQNILKAIFKILTPNLKGKKTTPDKEKLYNEYEEEFKRLKTKLSGYRNEAHARLTLKEMYPNFDEADIIKISRAPHIREKALLVVGIRNNRVTTRLKDWISEVSSDKKKEDRLLKKYNPSLYSISKLYKSL